MAAEICRLCFHSLGNSTISNNRKVGSETALKAQIVAGEAAGLSKKRGRWGAVSPFFIDLKIAGPIGRSKFGVGQTYPYVRGLAGRALAAR
jgi:hypothetical protein